MGQRRIGQLGFMDAAVSRRGGGGRRGGLDEISRRLAWSGLEGVLAVIPWKAKAEPSFPALMMFKVLLLQRWYGLSDPAMEAALSDSLSFMAFAGLSLDDETPDHSTIWRFRQALGEKGLLDPLLAELNRQLEGRGVVIRQGTLIDASVVSSAA